MRRLSRNMKAYSMRSPTAHRRTTPWAWLYKTQFDDYVKAENHFQTAVKCDPLYPHSYFHIAALLMDMERFDELHQHLEKCLRIRTIDKSWVYGRFALSEELRRNYEKAIYYFEKAILSCQNDEKIKDYRQDIERCQMKTEIWKRHGSSDGGPAFAEAPAGK